MINKHQRRERSHLSFELLDDRVLLSADIAACLELPSDLVNYEVEVSQVFDPPSDPNESCTNKQIVGPAACIDPIDDPITMPEPVCPEVIFDEAFDGGVQMVDDEDPIFIPCPPDLQFPFPVLPPIKLPDLDVNPPVLPPLTFPDADSPFSVEPKFNFGDLKITPSFGQTSDAAPKDPPQLSKLPYINRLFRNTADLNSDESSLLLVTPRIIIQVEVEGQ